LSTITILIGLARSAANSARLFCDFFQNNLSAPVPLLTPKRRALSLFNAAIRVRQRRDDSRLIGAGGAGRLFAFTHENHKIVGPRRAVTVCLPIQSAVTARRDPTSSSNGQFSNNAANNKRNNAVSFSFFSHFFKEVQYV
jgi:hypothetical protein